MEVSEHAKALREAREAQLSPLQERSYSLFNGYLCTFQRYADWAYNKSHITSLATSFSTDLKQEDLGKTLYDLLKREINTYDIDCDDTVGVFTLYSR